MARIDFFELIFMDDINKMRKTYSIEKKSSVGKLIDLLNSPY